MRLQSLGMVMGLLLAQSGLSYTDTVQLKTLPEDKWEAAELQTLEQAAKRVSHRIHQAHIYSCAKPNSWRGIPNSQAWNMWMGPFRRQQTMTITIHKQSLVGRRVAEAEVGSASFDRWRNRVLNLSITMDAEAVERRRGADAQSIDYWTKVLAHEVGHNLGLRHGTPKGADFESNYAGYFVTELGYCVMSNGHFGSAMGDSKLIRQRRLHQRQTGGHAW